MSWAVLRGRCADCGVRISARYPLIEAVTAVAFAAIAWVVGPAWTLPLLLAAAFFSIVLTVVDLETRRLPDRIVAPFALVTVMALVLAAAMAEAWWDLARAGAGALVLGAVYLTAFLVYPRGMGFGDVKLAPVIGAILGFFGWSELAVGGFAAFLWGALAGVVAMAMQRRGRGVAIPFGPWMLLGLWTGLAVGAQVGTWYLGVIGLS